MIASASITLTNLTDGLTSFYQYAKNTSDTIPPTTGWSTAMPSRTSGEFIWRREASALSLDDVAAWGNAVCLTGATGASGPKGDTGEQGPQGPPGNPGELGIYADGSTLHVKGFAEDGTLTAPYAYLYAEGARHQVNAYSETLTNDGQGYVLFDGSSIHFAKLTANSESKKWLSYNTLEEYSISMFVIGSFVKNGELISDIEVLPPQRMDQFEIRHFMEILKSGDIQDINVWALANGIDTVFQRIAMLEAFVNKLVANEGFIELLGASQITLNNNGAIQSKDFISSEKGFRVKASGEAEFKEGTFRGNIYSTPDSYYTGSIKNDQIETSSDSGTAYNFSPFALQSSVYNAVSSAPVGVFASGSTYQGPEARLISSTTVDSETDPYMYQRGTCCKATDGTVYLGIGNKIISSSDGINFQEFSVPAEYMITGLAYSPTLNRFVLSFRTKVYDNEYYYCKYGYGSSISNISITTVTGYNYFDKDETIGIAGLIWSPLLNRFISTNNESSDGINWTLNPRKANLHLLDGTVTNYSLSNLFDGVRTRNYMIVGSREYAICSYSGSFNVIIYTDNGTDWYEITSWLELYGSRGNDFSRVSAYIPETNKIFYFYNSYAIVVDTTTNNVELINIYNITGWYSYNEYSCFSYNSKYKKYIISSDNANDFIVLDTDLSKAQRFNAQDNVTLLWSLPSDRHFAIDHSNGYRVGIGEIIQVSYPLTQISKSVSGGVIKIEMNQDSSKDFYIENTSDPLIFGMNASIPERLLIKKDLTTNPGVRLICGDIVSSGHVNGNVNSAGTSNKVYGAVAN
jgi:hypothetical protein